MGDIPDAWSSRPKRCGGFQRKDDRDAIVQILSEIKSDEFNKYMRALDLIQTDLGREETVWFGNPTAPPAVNPLRFVDLCMIFCGCDHSGRWRGPVSLFELIF